MRLRKRERASIEPWWFALTAEEQAVERRVSQAIEAYLRKPPLRRPQAVDHAWSPQSCVCMKCNVSLVAFHDRPVPCLS